MSFGIGIKRVRASFPEDEVRRAFTSQVILRILKKRDNMEIAGKAALENTFFSSLYSPDDTSDLNKEFVAEYKKAYNTNPDVFAALAYDSALLVAKAIEDAGSADPAKIAEAMAKIKGFKGVSGEVTFNEQHNPIKSAVIIEHKDGKQTFKTKVNP